MQGGNWSEREHSRDNFQENFIRRRSDSLAFSNPDDPPRPSKQVSQMMPDGQSPVNLQQKKASQLQILAADSEGLKCTKQCFTAANPTYRSSPVRTQLLNADGCSPICKGTLMCRACLTSWKCKASFQSPTLLSYLWNVRSATRSSANAIFQGFQKLSRFKATICLIRHPFLVPKDQGLTE